MLKNKYRKNVDLHVLVVLYILLLVFGVLLIQYHEVLLWLKLKIFLVVLLAFYHIWCGKIMYDFKCTNLT